MKSSILAVLGGASTALAAVRGFNYASQGQSYDGFASQFKTAASLAGADDFTSARLYTMIQEGTTNTPIDAIQAAIDTNTTLLLGLWASVDQSSFDNEITALKSAISQYGSSFAELVVGISVGSEDLYRISETGIAAGSGVGQSPDVLVDYIGQVRSAIKGTSLGSKPVGHVDTWNVYATAGYTSTSSSASSTATASKNGTATAPSSFSKPTTEFKPSLEASQSGSPRLAGPFQDQPPTLLLPASMMPRHSGKELHVLSRTVESISGGTSSMMKGLPHHSVSAAVVNPSTTLPAVPATATGSSGAGATGAAGATATQTQGGATGTAPVATSTYTGAAIRSEGSMAGLAIGALVAALVL